MISPRCLPWSSIGSCCTCRWPLLAFFLLAPFAGRRTPFEGSENSTRPLHCTATLPRGYLQTLSVSLTWLWSNPTPAPTPPPLRSLSDKGKWSTKVGLCSDLQTRRIREGHTLNNCPNRWLGCLSRKQLPCNRQVRLHSPGDRAFQLLTSPLPVAGCLLLSLYSPPLLIVAVASRHLRRFLFSTST